MKYFIDFEATQFSEEIISVGCIREDGETFYSLVAPVEGKITPFITNLTGITAEMLKDAMSPDTVFEKFYDWAFADISENPEFFCWGNSDASFLRHTFKRTTSYKARVAIGYMTAGVIDYAKRFCQRIKAKQCGLVKAYNGLIDENKEQNHNSLDDAVMLYEVYQVVEVSETDYLRDRMKNYIALKSVKKEVEKEPESSEVVKWNCRGFSNGTICIINNKKEALYNFPTLKEAIDWVMNNFVPADQREVVKRDTLSKNIKKAYTNGSMYCGYKWRIVNGEAVD